MADHFSAAQWQVINDELDRDPGGYGLPMRRADSVVMASWNIRKLGALADAAGSKKSPGATAMLTRFCAQADLIAVQEVQSDTEALYDLRDRLNRTGANYQVALSDVTGRAPGQLGSAERFAYLYDTTRVRRGDLASDLGFDRSAVLNRVRAALEVAVPEGEDAPDLEVLDKNFVDFIRSPHLVEFVIEGTDRSAYRFHCVNAHLVSGSTKGERAREFFALLEWLMHDSKSIVSGETSYVVLGDLNLDFKSNVSNRREAIDNYIKGMNAENRITARINFPFLDGGFFTNARGNKTFDHIYWVSEDDRLPRGRHNSQVLAGDHPGVAYGMFDFVRLFQTAGPGAKADGSPDFEKFEHDFTDHMPIWLRLPMPDADQHKFTVA